METEQDLSVKDREQDAAGEEAADVVEWEVIAREQALEGFAYALIATYLYRIKWAPHAIA